MLIDRLCCWLIFFLSYFIPFYQQKLLSYLNLIKYTLFIYQKYHWLFFLQSLQYQITMQEQYFQINEIAIPLKEDINHQKSRKIVPKHRRRTLKKTNSCHKQQRVNIQQKMHYQNPNNFDLNLNLRIKMEAFRFNQTHSDNFSKKIFSKRASDMILNRKQQSQKEQIKVKNQKYSLNKFQNSKLKSSKKLNTLSTIQKKDNLSLKLKNYEQSPYIGKKSNISKLIKMLRPVKGINESIQKQILKYNDLNKKNHELVLMRNFNDNFEIKRQKYLQRIGLKSNQKVFLMNSRDYHIKEGLLKRGWVQLDDLTDGFFHLKWVYSDSSNDYSNLNKGQLFNHFHNNQQLTNKNNLRKNIKNTPLKDQPRIPLTYDLGIAEEYKIFNDKALEFQSFKILSLIIDHLKAQQAATYQRILSNPNYFKYLNKNLKRTDCLYQPVQFFYRINCLKPNINQKQQIFIENLLQIIHFMMKNIQKQTNIKFTLLKLKLQDKKKKIHNNIHQVFKYFKKLFQNKYQPLLYFKNLTAFMKVQLVKLYQHYQKMQSFKYKSYGKQNIWIVKPTGVSRGTGIYLQSEYQNLFSHTNSQHGRIVQKYIQKPFLLKDKRKFDLRQWVLVKRFQPLEAYIFNKLYGRICHQKYLQTDYQNVNRHLTNYSLAKQLYVNKKPIFNGIQESSALFSRINLKKSEQNSIILQQDLREYIQKLCFEKPQIKRRMIQHQTGKQRKIIRKQQNKQQYPYQPNKILNNKSWHQIKLNIKKDIIKTLKACCVNIEPNPSSFQVYGFDILLDENLQPYIIQVNLSPACQKRQGLQFYLQQMSNGLVDYFQQWIGCQKSFNKNASFSRLNKQAVWEQLDQTEIQEELRQINEGRIKQESAIWIQKWFRKLLASKANQHNNI